jgi:copper chaperone
MLELTLPDMTCGHCVKTITGIVQRLDPAAQLAVDLPAHRVAIDSGVDADRIKAALAEQGYPPAA